MNAPKGIFRNVLIEAAIGISCFCTGSALLHSEAFAGDDEAEKIDHYQSRQALGTTASSSPSSVSVSSATIATLSNGTGDGSVTVTVDAYGSFGSSTPAGDAVYDPVGLIGGFPVGPAGTTYESGVYFGPLGNFLTSDSFGAALPLIPFSVVSSTFAISEFDIAGFHIHLTQEVSPVGPGGSTFTQTYRIRNDTGINQSFNVVRHVDGDLYFVGIFNNDFGGISTDGSTLFEFDTGDDPQAPTTFFGISTTGGQRAGYTIQPFRFTDDIFFAGGIPANVHNRIFRDDNNDGITDSGYDVTLSIEDVLSVDPGQTVTYITKTIFGQGATAGAAFDIIDPVDDKGAGYLLDSTGKIVTNVNALIGANVRRDGVVADGVTQLLLRARVPAGTPTVTFSIGSGRGSLRALGSSGAGTTSLSVPPQNVNGELWAFAVYISPLNFVPTDDLLDPDRYETRRPVQLQASGTFGTIRSPLMLERPPILLVHGVWSGPSVWDEQGFKNFLTQRGFVHIEAVNYETDSASHFDPGIPIPDNKPLAAFQKGLGQALSNLRKSRIAGTQVDVVGHSTGGLLARAYDKIPGYWANQRAGDIHKLIAIDSPHYGSKLANFLFTNKDALVCLESDLFGNCVEAITLKEILRRHRKPIDQGLVEDLQHCSGALKSLHLTQIPSHAVAGNTGGDLTCTEISLNTIIWLVLGFGTVDTLLESEYNDTIVTVESQRGGIGGFGVNASTDISGVVHTDLCSLSTHVIESSTTKSTVVELLRLTVDSPGLADKRFGNFPRPAEFCSGSANLVAALSASTASSAAITTSTTRTADLVANQASPGIMFTSPSPDQLVHPGDTVVVRVEAVGSLSITNALFLIEGGTILPSDEGLLETQFVVPEGFIGPKELIALTRATDGNLYAALTRIQVQPLANLTSITVTPSDTRLTYFGQEFELSVVGNYDDGVSRDIRASAVGTTYATLSGTDFVVQASPEGIVRAVGDGQDVILVSNSGLTNAVLVRVEISNFPPMLDPIADRTVGEGTVVNVPVAASDPDGNAITLSAISLPPFATFRDNGNGTGLLRLAPTTGQNGLYNITLTALDDGTPNLGDSETFYVTVVPSQGPCPNLTGSWLNLVQTCKTKGDGLHCKVKGKLVVQNIGTTNAPTSFVRYYLSDDAVFDAGDTLLKQQATGTVNLNKPKKRTLSAKLPVGVSGSGKFIIAVIDAANTVVECNEINNVIVFGPLP